jgi:hypothetical protein
VFLPRIVIWSPIGDVSAIRALRYYGIDMATRAERIGADLSEQEICDFVGADSLHYITLDGLIAATPNERDNLCTACFTGEYPIPVPGEHEQLAQVKFDFEALTASCGLSRSAWWDTLLLITVRRWRAHGDGGEGQRHVDTRDGPCRACECGKRRVRIGQRGGT